MVKSEEFIILVVMDKEEAAVGLKERELTCNNYLAAWGELF